MPFGREADNTNPNPTKPSSSTSSQHCTSLRWSSDYINVSSQYPDVFDISQGVLVICVVVSGAEREIMSRKYPML